MDLFDEFVKKFHLRGIGEHPSQKLFAQVLTCCMFAVEEKEPYRMIELLIDIGINNVHMLK